MDITKKAFEGYEHCFELTSGGRKMVITADFGPRIIYFGLDKGTNILYFNNKPPEDKTVWYSYGGHRIWTAPESFDTYFPDNQECRVHAGKDTISISGYDTHLKLEKTLTVTAEEDRFFVTNTIMNTGKMLVNGAIWAITCIDTRCKPFFPWGTEGGWQMSKIIYWQNWCSSQTSDIFSSQYVKTKDYFIIEPTGEMGKVGTAGHQGWIGAAFEDTVFIKRFDRLPTNDYPDDNCAIECYTGKDFLELETLSPNMVFMPGVPVSHTEEWILAEKHINPRKSSEVDKLIASFG